MRCGQPGPIRQGAGCAQLYPGFLAVRARGSTRPVLSLAVSQKAVNYDTGSTVQHMSPSDHGAQFLTD